MTPDFTFEIEAQLPSLVKSTTEYIDQIDQADKKLLTRASLRDKDKDPNLVAVRQVYQLRHNTEYNAEFIDTKNIPKRFEYEDKIIELSLPVAQVSTVFSFGNLIRARLQEQGETEVKEEPEEIIALFDEREEDRTVPKQSFSSSKALQEASSRVNPFANEEVYGRGYEFYLRHEKLIINYKLFKEHYQTTKRICDYKDSSSIKQPKGQNLRNYLPEQFGLELQKFIETHPKKEQKILIGLLSDRDFELLAPEYKEEAMRQEHKEWLSKYLYVATRDYQDYKGYGTLLPINLVDSDENVESPAVEEEENKEKAEGSESSAVSQLGNEEIEEMVAEANNEEMSFQVVEKEEYKVHEEPQEEIKQQNTDQREKINQETIKKAANKENKYKIDPHTRKECEDDLAFQIIDDHFLTVLVNQFSKDSIENEKKITCLRSLCISPETELKVISLVLHVLEYPTYDFSTLFWNQSRPSLIPNPVDNLNHLFQLLVSLTREKAYIPNEFLERYTPQPIKAFLQTEGAIKEKKVAFSFLDRVILLLHSINFSENSKLGVDILNYVLETFDIRGIEVASTEAVLTIEQLLQKPKIVISTNSVNVLVEMFSKHGSQYSQSKDVFVKMCKLPSKMLIQNFELILGACLEKINSLNAQMETGLTNLKQARGLEQKSQIGAKLTSDLPSLERLLKEATKRLWWKVMGKERKNKSKPETAETQKLKLTRRMELGKKIAPLIQEVLDSQIVLELIFNLFEILTQYAKFFSTTTKEGYNIDHLLTFISVLSSFYSFYTMNNEIKANSDTQVSQVKETGSIDSLPEVNTMPKLSRFISKERDILEVGPVTLNRSVSQIKRQTFSVNLNEIYHECLYKIKDLLNFGLERTKSDEKTSPILINFVKKFPYTIDFNVKEIIAGVRYRNQEPRVQQQEIVVRRDHLIQESLIHFKNPKVLESVLKIKYNGEAGYDAGGLKRGWFTDISREVFDPQFGLFKVSANKSSIQPSVLSAFLPDYEKYFEFAGAFVAKAIRENCPIEVYFNRCFIKHILGSHLTLNDLEDLDPALTKSLKWMLENNVEELMLDFTYELDLLDYRITKELKPDGANIPVDEKNKKEYVRLVALAKMRDEIAQQIRSFQLGFYKVIPRHELSAFSDSDLNLLIAGEPEINVDELEKTAVISDFPEDKSSPTVIWFWEIVRAFDKKTLAALLYFSSGSTRVPHGGYKNMPLELCYAGPDSELLPVAHTCSNCIDFPEYTSKEKLEEKLLTAIFEGVEGYWIS